jgi:hypothetical protein
MALIPCRPAAQHCIRVSTASHQLPDSEEFLASFYNGLNRESQLEAQDMSNLSCDVLEMTMHGTSYFLIQRPALGADLSVAVDCALLAINKTWR